MDVLCAAIGKPVLLVLDEPTSGVDPEGRAVVWDFIRSLSSQGCAVLASTHDMAEAEAFADTLLVMATGKIRLQGSVNEVLFSLGGDRRLRLVNPNAQVVALVENSGLRYGRAGSSIVVIGNTEKISELSMQIDAVGGVQDVLSGAVRLEDIFAVVTGLTTEAVKQ